MTGFSSEWLALREPADHAARDPGLVAELARTLAEHAEVRVVDLGCGAGSNLRGLAPHLGPRQSWRLVDYDPALLAAARNALLDWADHWDTEGEALVLTRDEKRIRVAFAALDLSAGLGGAIDPAAKPDLVTAAALFDLVSKPWIDDFVRSVAEAGSVFYTALSYDGAETWDPPHPDDGAMHAAFLAHQSSDKGFGAAMGPGATAALADAFRQHGYDVVSASSPWRLGPGHPDLIRQLKDGKAAAAAETGLMAPGAIDDWSAARSRPGTAVLVGHADLLAVPPQSRLASRNG
ncbi:SAM-dependent methyltransferase [uncultured Methylobacterium sp.]|uniref:SAM-dependent methyltransferase n=1 Tax=uncultured Methylobacterium sp. TaxID=157278 RepID=UPI0035CC26BA